MTGDTKGRILDAAEIVFADKGLAGARVSVSLVEQVPIEVSSEGGGGAPVFEPVLSEPVATVITDDEGNYALSDVPAARVSVVASFEDMDLTGALEFQVSDRVDRELTAGGSDVVDLEINAVAAPPLGRPVFVKLEGAPHEDAPSVSGPAAAAGRAR